jgi:hypothetical protein
MRKTCNFTKRGQPKGLGASANMVSSQENSFTASKGGTGKPTNNQVPGRGVPEEEMLARLLERWKVWHSCWKTGGEVNSACG